MIDTRRGLKALLATIGAVATVAGARGVLRGAAEVSGNATVPASVDSEYRFYAAWYPVFGLLLLRAARRPELDTAPVWAAAGGFLTAASGRLLSWQRLGPPNAGQKVLLGLELALPMVVVPWQRAVANGRGHS